jgi:hypothetical protein
MSKIFMPSHDALSVTRAPVLVHESSERGESVDRNSRLP